MRLKRIGNTGPSRGVGRRRGDWFAVSRYAKAATILRRRIQAMNKNSKHDQSVNSGRASLRDGETSGVRRGQSSRGAKVNPDVSQLKLRKHPVHGVLSISDQPSIVCLTVCTKDRKKWLLDSDVHDLLVDVWREADLWLVGRYVIMPDHLHLFAGERGDVPLDNWVRYWKSQFTKRHGVKTRRWQTDHWDRRVRSEADFEDAWNYVYSNPVRAGLVTDPESWPFSGQVFDVRWD